MGDTIPNQDPQAVIYMQTFRNGLQANHGMYMVGPPDCLAIGNAVDAFAAALTISSVPATRTKVSVADKDAKRISTEQIVRQYSTLIKFNAGISDSDKIAIIVGRGKQNRFFRTLDDSFPR